MRILNVFRSLIELLHEYSMCHLLHRYETVRLLLRLNLVQTAMNRLAGRSDGYNIEKMFFKKSDRLN